jgi:ABC-type nitrate/sulfonate/bicarbonate transport system substrate-binding protein
MRQRTSRGSVLRWGSAVTALGLVLASCSGEEDRGTVIRFLIAPDPVWDYLTDQGIVAEYEEKYDITIETTSSWDEFQFFAGGHGDVVSTGTLELPILEEETGIDTVTFGRYNATRSTPAAPCEEGYETLEDLPEGSRVGVNSPLSSTILWDLYSREQYGFPFEVNNDESPFEFFVEDHFVLPEHMARGDLDAAVIIPEAGAPFLRSGELCYMYDDRAAWQIFAEILPNKDHKGGLSNGFTTTKEYYEENPEAIQAFLALWERGLQEWADNKEEIVRTYPQHFTVEDEEDIQYIVDYLESDRDYFQPTVYLNKEWIHNETQIYAMMKQYGMMDESQEDPEFVAVEPIE